MSKVIETSATVDERGHLELDEPIAPAGPRRVRVIVLLPDDQSGDISEGEWLAARRNPDFDFLQHPRWTCTPRAMAGPSAIGVGRSSSHSGSTTLRARRRGRLCA